MGQANKRELVLRVWLPISGSGHRLSDRFGFRPSFQSKYLCHCLLIFLTLACICRYYDDDLIMNPTCLVGQGHGEFLDIVRCWIDDNGVCMGNGTITLSVRVGNIYFFPSFFFFPFSFSFFFAIVCGREEKWASLESLAIPREILYTDVETWNFSFSLGERRKGKFLVVL